MQMQQKPQKRVLVTGGEAYLASHIIALLLKKNYYVRTTVRSFKKSDKFAHLLTLSPNAKTNLEIIQADLLNESECELATKDCMVVFHVASTFPPKIPKDEGKLIKPAVRMTLNLMHASVKSGVKKFILTSSVLAVMVGNENAVCNEDFWSSEAACTPYEKSKLLTEKAAWKCYENYKDRLEFSVLCPGLLWGPVLGKKKFKSGELVESIMNRQIQVVPAVVFPIVDVRDAATAHLRVMERRETNGKRYLIVSDSVSGEYVMDVLREEFSQYGYKFPKLKIGKMFARIVAIFNPMFKIFMSAIGTRYEVNNKRSVEELEMEYIPVNKSLLEMVYSMIEKRIIPDNRGVVPKL